MWVSRTFQYNQNLSQKSSSVSLSSCRTTQSPQYKIYLNLDFEAFPRSTWRPFIIMRLKVPYPKYYFTPLSAWIYFVLDFLEWKRLKKAFFWGKYFSIYSNHTHSVLSKAWWNLRKKTKAPRTFALLTNR